MPPAHIAKTQDAEAAKRAAEAAKTPELHNGPTDVADAPVADAPVAEPGSPPVQARTSPAPAPEPEPRRAPEVRSPKDDQRARIAARWREARNAETEDDVEADVAEIRKFARSGMPPELLGEPVQAPAPVAAEPDDDQLPVEAADDEPVEAEAEPEPVEPTPTRKLVIRGKTVELTEDQLIAAAQKALASDDYLDEARNKLAEVNRLFDSTKQRVAQPAPTGTHPPGENVLQTPEPVEQPGDDGTHPSDPFAKVVETIQFGDPKDAATSFQEVTRSLTDNAVQVALRNERIRNDAVHSAKVLADFKTAHPELANDAFASAAMERRLYDLQVEDMRNLGVDEAVIPKTPGEVANWHQFYRVEGHNVRDAGTLLATARDDFLKWRGVGSPTTPPAAKNGPPKVAVSVDRQARRAAIAPQPTRTVTPKPDAVTTPAQPRSRSSVVQQMMAARAKGRGSVVTT